MSKGAASTEYRALLKDALKAVVKQKPKVIRRVAERKKDFDELSRGVAEHGLQRLTSDSPNRLRTYAREMELMEILKGVFTIARRMARNQAE